MICTATLGTILALTQVPVASTTVFHGRPIVKVQETGLDRSAETLTSAKAAGFECVISRIGDAYYWASRENVVLSLRESDGYLTFVADNGSGYIKIVKPEMKAALRQRFAAEQLSTIPEHTFDYIEHLHVGLSTLSYYGLASGR
jgi:hypothetical protein